MVQLHNLTTSDYLPKSNIFDDNYKQILKNNLQFFSHSFDFGINVISEISGPLLIGQNDSLGLLLLVDICIQFKKGRNDLTDTFGSKFDF